MIDREKVIEELEHCRQLDFEMKKPTQVAIDNALALLKVQASEENRILKAVWYVLHSGVSTDRKADQDWVYEQIRNRVHPMYDDGPKQVGLYGKEDWYGLVCVCPDCDAEWMSGKDETNFCPKCGTAVKWIE